MSGLELNKIAAAILVAGLIAMIAGTISRGIYGTDSHHGEEVKRGYQIEIVSDNQPGGDKEEKEEIDIATLLATADAGRGRKVSKKCISCHSFEKDGGHKVGPNLWGILGEKQAHSDDYQYSKAFQNLDGTWDYEKIFAYLKNPKKYVKGTKMAFIGLKKPEDIANLVAFLRESSDNPPPLPDVTAPPNPEIIVDAKDDIINSPAEKEGQAEAVAETSAEAENEVEVEITEGETPEEEEESSPDIAQPAEQPVEESTEKVAMEEPVLPVEKDIETPFDEMVIEYSPAAGVINSAEIEEEEEDNITVFELDGSPDTDQPLP